MLFFPETTKYAWLLAPLVIYGRYAFLCAWLYALLYVWRRRYFLRRKIQLRFPKGSDVRREMGYSFLTALIFAATAWLLLATPLRAHTRLYTDISAHGMPYLVGSVLIVVLLHDAYFYWMHRLMHHPFLYRRMHLTHHRSVNPTPWAAYAFHPLEAVAEAGILPLAVFLLPLHPLALFSFITIMLWFNVYGHLGYEFFPRKMYLHPLGRWLNSSIYHNAHHERFTGNYGLYFTFWDRIMGTLRADSAAEVEAVHTRIESNSPTYSKTKLPVMSATLKNFWFALALPALAAPAQAQTVNWATDVAPILYEHCVKCHRDGGIGHFSLIGYDNAQSNKLDILDATGARRMPPWMPDPGYRHFTGENILSADEIQTIQDWVAQGAPAGDLAQAPPDPVFFSGSEIGQPDQILHTPLYTLQSASDEYRCFVVPSGLNAAAFLRGLEVLPGNHEAVHHVLVFEDTTGQAKIFDQQTAEPGYVNFGGIGVPGARLVGAWVPGATARLLPPFMGVKLHPGADLVFQVHFPGSAQGMTETTTVNLFFTPSNTGIREVSIAPLLNHAPPSLENGPLVIPANTVKTFHEKYTVPINGSLIAVAPHMHLIGRSITCYGVSLPGDTIPLIKIPNWDFHWQGYYSFQKVQKIPIGTKLHAYATYDNTLNNPYNPSDPPQLVTAGEATTDEMMLVYFVYMQYQAGDENIVLDSTLLTSAVHEPVLSGPIRSLALYPNPASERAQLDFTLNEKSALAAEIIDPYGRILKVFGMYKALPAGVHHLEVETGDLPPGLYFVRLRTDSGGAGTVRLLKQ